MSVLRLLEYEGTFCFVGAHGGGHDAQQGPWSCYSGAIPDEFARLTTLKRLELNRNKLSGAFMPLAEVVTSADLTCAEAAHHYDS